MKIKLTLTIERRRPEQPRVEQFEHRDLDTLVETTPQPRYVGFMVEPAGADE